jgi:hypothetical protein
MRHIFDLDSQWLGKLEGEASFTHRADGLAYYEQGMLQFGGLTAMQATRRYFWAFPHPDRIDVFFEDGGFFHHFDPTLGRAMASHYCDPDEYEVTYDFRRWPHWRAEWRVEGPQKDYRMVSMYDPLEARRA